MISTSDSQVKSSPPRTGVVILAAALALSSAPAPGSAALPELSLEDHLGQPFGTAQLAGKVWIAHFFSTRCAPECQATIETMRGLQSELFNHPKWDDVRLVSVTLDPVSDTVGALRDYARAEAFAYDRNWRFLTGGRTELRKLGEALGLPLAEGDAPAPLAFALVDGAGRVRGTYEATRAEGWKKLVADVDRVLSEHEPSGGGETALPKVAYPEPGEGRPPWLDASDPAWLEPRAKAQKAAAGEIEVFHGFRFTDRVGESGITFLNRVVDDAGQDYKGVHYDHGNGVAVADVDGDALLDVYFTTQLGRNQLWRNLGGGKFEDVTARAGVGLGDRISVTGSFADTDNDGDADLMVTAVRDGNVFFENDGTGAFKEVTAAAGLEYRGHPSAAIFFDYDRDGLLDLFLCVVGRYTGDPRGRGGYYVGFPDAFAGHLHPDRTEESVLYRNTGGNRFVDVTAQAGLADDSWTGDATAVDLDVDGDQDLYVLDMQGNDEYFENVDGERFVRRSRELFPLTPWGSMGIKAFDFDNDGAVDILITDMHSDMSEMVGPESEKLKSDMKWPKEALGADAKPIFGNALFRNDGAGRFEEVSDAMGAENYWPWGFSVGDLNADGWDDVLITSSMNFPWRYGVNTLLLNDRGEKFRDSEFIVGVEPRKDGRTVTPWFELDCSGDVAGHPLYGPICEGRSGPVEVQGALGSRASVLFDLDEDGDLDVVTNELNSEPMVLVSDLSEKTALRFLKVRLIGTKSNRDGLGARVTVHAGGASRLKVHDGKSGYLSQSSAPLYFGLGSSSEVDRIEVVWPSGVRQTVEGPIAANRTREITEEVGPPPAR